MTRRGDKSPAQRFASCDTVNFVKIIFAAADFVAAISCTNLKQFEFARLIAATKSTTAVLSHRLYTSGNKAMRQNINELAKERHILYLLIRNIE